MVVAWEARQGPSGPLLGAAMAAVVVRARVVRDVVRRIVGVGFGVAVINGSASMWCGLVCR